MNTMKKLNYNSSAVRTKCTALEVKIRQPHHNQSQTMQPRGIVVLWFVHSTPFTLNSWEFMFVVWEWRIQDVFLNMMTCFQLFIVGYYQN